VLTLFVAVISAAVTWAITYLTLQTQATRSIAEHTRDRLYRAYKPMVECDLALDSVGDAVIERDQNPDGLDHVRDLVRSYEASVVLLGLEPEAQTLMPYAMQSAKATNEFHSLLAESVKRGAVAEDRERLRELSDAAALASRAMIKAMRDQLQGLDDVLYLPPLHRLHILLTGRASAGNGNDPPRLGS
jgi:hypothetical protein